MRHARTAGPARCLRLLLCALCLGITSAAIAQDDDPDDVFGGFDEPAEESGASEADDVLGGFDDDATEPGDAPTAEDEQAGSRWWDLTGATSLAASYNVRSHYASLGPDPTAQNGTYWGNVSRLRLRQDVQLDLYLPRDWKTRVQAFVFYDFAYLIHGRSEYTDRVIQDYEVEAEILDLWVEGSVTSYLDLKLGRQVVNWGRSDTLRVNDVLNPLNSREPGLTDIENLRLPVTMAKADLYWRQWSLSVMIIPEIRYDYLPPPGHDFFPYVSLTDLPPLDPSWPFTLEDIPPGTVDSSAFADLDPDSIRADRWGSVPEIAGAITGVFSGWDVSLYVARVYQNQTSSIVNLPTGRFITDDDKITMVGAGGNYTFGSWLFKAEAAYFNELNYTYLVPIPPDPTNLPNPADPALSYFYAADSTVLDRFDYMLGVECYEFNDVTIAAEFAHRYYIDYEPLLRYLPVYQFEHNFEVALRVTADMLNARLHLTALGLVLANDEGFNGSTIRLSADYDILDALVIGGGLLYFVGSDQIPFDTWENNDRLFLKLKYSY